MSAHALPTSLRARLFACALALGALAGCGDDEDSSAAQPDGGAPDGAAPSTVPDASGDPHAGAAAHAPDSGLDERDGAPPAAEPDAALGGCQLPAGSDEDGGSGAPTASELTLELPPAPRPGTPFTVAISVEGGWSGEAELCLDGRLVATANVYRGRGSASMTVTRTGAALLRVHAGGSTLERALDVSERSVRALSGALSGDDLSWSRDADVRLSGDVQVPAGARLTIGAGTRVLLDANAALEIAGELQIHGAPEEPVVFAPAGEQPWGGVRVLPGGSALIEHAWLGGGGGDSARAFGHSDSQPVLWAERATVELRGGGIVDNVGKALGSDEARLTVRDALISRCDTGGQLDSTELLMERSHVLEMPDADGRFDDDDNDGIYLLSALAEADGTIAPSIIRDSVFARGEDDAIDHNNAVVRIERVWIEGFHHEGLAASSGNSATIVDSVVRDCGQGIEAGYGTPTVEVDHCLLTGNDVGLRFGDSYDRGTNGTLSVRNTIAYGNNTNVRNYVNQLGGPLEGALTITCSLVDDPAYDEADGNLPGAPQGDLHASGCAIGPAAAAECDQPVSGPRTCFQGP